MKLNKSCSLTWLDMERVPLLTESCNTENNWEKKALNRKVVAYPSEEQKTSLEKAAREN